MSKSKPIILVVSGGDSFQRERALQALMADRFGSEEVEIHKFDAKTKGAVADVLAEVLSFSMFAANKAIVLDRFDEGGEDEMEPLYQFIALPRGDALLLLMIGEGKKVPAKLTKMFPKDAFLTLEKTTPIQVRDLVQKKLTAQKVQIQKNALEFLVDAVGGDVERALREADKLLLWAEAGQNLSLDDVRKLVKNDAEEEIWAITRLVAEKKSESALQTLNHLVDQGENPIALVGLLTRLFRQMYHCKTLEKEKVPPAQWPDRVGLRGYPLDITKKNSQGFSLSSLRSGLMLLRQTDDDLKGGKPGSPEGLKYMVLERLILDLCRLDKPVASR